MSGIDFERNRAKRCGQIRPGNEHLTKRVSSFYSCNPRGFRVAHSWGNSMTTYEQVNIIIGSLNLVASYGGLALIYHGIRVMSKNADMRAADSERKHGEVMAESKRRHDEAMAESRRREEEGLRRHEESMAKHEESMAALRELIERTR